MSIRRFVPVVLAALPLTTFPLRAADAAPVVAHIKLSGDLDETPVSSDPLFGGSAENFKSKLDRIHKAAKDDAVKALYLEIDGVSAGWGKLDELTRAIAEFRKTGKKMFAYMEGGDAKDYLLATACDEVCVPESGWLMLTGVRAEVSFYKDLFDKIGVKADMLHMGESKSAAEPYTQTKHERSQPQAARRRARRLLREQHGRPDRPGPGRQELHRGSGQEAHRRGPVRRPGRREGRPDRPRRLQTGPRRFVQEGAESGERQIWCATTARPRPTRSTCPTRSPSSNCSRRRRTRRRATSRRSR